MRLLTSITGITTIVFGLFLITRDGVTFSQVAFLIGALFLFIGIIECISYRSYRGDDEEKTWVLIDGATTFALGFFVISGQISIDTVTATVFGFYVFIIGIRNFVRAFEHRAAKNQNFYSHIIIALLNTLVGFYIFFDPILFNAKKMLLIGLCVVVEGINLFNVGISIVLKKIRFIQTKDEIVSDTSIEARKKHNAARYALLEAEEAKKKLDYYNSTPEELLDLTTPGKPVSKEEKEFADYKAQRMEEEKARREKIKQERIDKKNAIKKEKEEIKRLEAEKKARVLEEKRRKAIDKKREEFEKANEAEKRKQRELEKEKAKLEAKKAEEERLRAIEKEKEEEALRKEEERKEELKKQEILEKRRAYEEEQNKKILEEKEKERKAKEASEKALELEKANQEMLAKKQEEDRLKSEREERAKIVSRLEKEEHEKSEQERRAYELEKSLKEQQAKREAKAELKRKKLEEKEKARQMKLEAKYNAKMAKLEKKVKKGE